MLGCRKWDTHTYRLVDIPDPSLFKVGVPLKEEGLNPGEVSLRFLRFLR
jgi:hypothetical protein